MDRYVLAEVKSVADTVRTQMDAYDITGACSTIREFLDVLTNWYLRTSRSRFTEGDKQTSGRSARRDGQTRATARSSAKCARRARPA